MPDPIEITLRSDEHSVFVLAWSDRTLDITQITESGNRPGCAITFSMKHDIAHAMQQFIMQNLLSPVKHT